MTQQTLILPYTRISPLHIPRRDLVVSAADCLELRVTVVDSDDPDALALQVVDGQTCSLVIYPDSDWHRWDYGAPQVAPGTVLWSGMGTMSNAVGSFEISVPTGAMAAWPRRCAWSVLLNWNGGSHAEMLAEGMLHVRPSVQAPMRIGPIVPPEPPIVPPGPGPIVAVEFTLDRDALSMGAMLAGGTGGVGGQPGGVGEPFFVMDATHLDTEGAII